MKKYLLSIAAAAFISPLHSAKASSDNDAFLNAEKKVRYSSYQDFKRVVASLIIR